VPLLALTNPAGLSRELQALANRPQLSARKNELEALAEDLASGRNLEMWAELDLLAAFVRPEPQEAPVPVSPRSPASSTSRGGLLAAAMWAWLRRVREAPLEAVLGVMVFVPLLVTWTGLRMAGGAYGELAKANPKEASRPFLQLWQSGFDGHLPVYERFDSVALTAVAFIGVLVLLAMWHAWARTRDEAALAEEETARAAVLAELASVLTRAQLALVRHKQTSPQRFTAELTAAAAQLRTLTDRALKTHTKLVQSADAAERAAAGLSAATDRLSGEVPALGAAADRIETAVRDAATALRDAQTRAADAIRTAQESTTRTGQDNATAVREVGERIVQAGQVVDTALKQLTTVQERLAGLSGEAVRASDKASQSMVISADRTGEAVEDMRKAAQQWDAAAAHWQDAAARLDDGIRRLAGTAPPTPVDAAAVEGAG
jgi:hypothetical protein